MALKIEKIKGGYENGYIVNFHGNDDSFCFVVSFDGEDFYIETKDKKDDCCVGIYISKEELNAVKEVIGIILNEVDKEET